MATYFFETITDAQAAWCSDAIWGRSSAHPELRAETRRWSEREPLKAAKFKLKKRIKL